MGPESSAPEPASLIVADPSGQRRRVPLEPLPFHIGRQPESHLVVRDSRVSRTHARILVEDRRYMIEDCGSRHGTFVNGTRIARQALQNSDTIEFGMPDSYTLTFALDGAELRRMLEQISTPEIGAVAGPGGNLARLRAILELARTLQSSLSIDDVLAAVVDTALAITAAERGFLMLRGDGGLETRIARRRDGRSLHDADLRVPREMIQRALHQRRELLYMNFDPLAGTRPQSSIADLELRSAICVPLVRIRAGQADVTSMISAESETVGLLYIDSRLAAADMAGGNRELLQTLAIEASTVLENARLLEEERAKRRIEEELRLARSIQQSLLPARLPAEGWMRASGSSIASLQVGGDYFDVAPVNADCWSVIVADVSGKGVGSALLASLLQGALMTATAEPESLRRRLERLNGFLLDRTGGEKYATLLYALLDRSGRFSYVNAAHCPAVVAGLTTPPALLDATGMPAGLIEAAEFGLAEQRLRHGDKVVIYSDGLTEARNRSGEFFGQSRLLDIVAAHAGDSCSALHDAIQDAAAGFTEGAAQSDDITVLVLEFSSAE
jgi:serine phosphatase RsbU (regulator of sigma subunit)